MKEKLDYLTTNMPFREELLEWCLEHHNFVDALKLINSSQFVVFNGTNLSTPPTHPKDQVIGIVVYDIKQEILKQDFIVDNNSSHNEFTLYTKLPGGSGFLYERSVVQSINDFYSKYDGDDKYYQDTHYPNLASLHPELQTRITDYLAKTCRILRTPPRTHYIARQ